MSESVYSKDYKDIIERLKRARIEVDLSQQAVADKLSKPQFYISKIESGERRLDVAEMKKFAAIYKKSADYFLMFLRFFIFRAPQTLIKKERTFFCFGISAGQKCGDEFFALGATL